MNNKSYEKLRLRRCLVILLGICLIIVLGIKFVILGAVDTDYTDVFQAIYHYFQDSLDGYANYKVLLYMRFPRIIMAIAAGWGLAIAGVGMQGVTSNSLVSPFTVGISSAAAFGASCCIVFGSGFWARQEGWVVGAFISAMICMVVVYAISSALGMKASSIVLAGIALNYFFQACTSALEFFADEYQLSAVVNWSFGTFNGVDWTETGIVIAFVTAGFIALMILSPKINVLMIGDDALSRSMGVNPTVIRALILIISVLITSAVISFTGVIGFVGLVAPHIGRIIIGEDNRYLIPFSAIIGSLLMLIADTIGRTILRPVSLPVGVVISFIGVPLFVILILRKRGGYHGA